MARFPLFGINTRGKSPNVTAMRRVNLYAEVQRQEDKTNIAFYGTPGLTLFSTLPLMARGMYLFETRFFAVSGNKLYEINSAGVITSRGTLATSSGRVDIDCNGIELMIVDGANGYSLILATNTFAQIVDVDFPGGNTVCFDSGFGIVNKPNTGQFWISDSYNFLSWDATNFATAEASPDNLVRVFADSGQVILFGAVTSEFWANSGAVDFSYTRVGAAVVDWGLVARWSVAKFNGRVACLMRNKLGQQQVVSIEGYQPVPISTPDVDYAISQYTVVTDAEAFSYNLGGHAMYELNFPTENKTWLFDGLSNVWSELESDGSRHVANLGAAFGNKYYVSSYVDGSIYELATNENTDNGAMISRQIVGRHIFDEGYRSIASIWVDMQMGVGTVSGQGVNPQLIMNISKDGGHTWSSDRYARLGAIGEYAVRAVFRRCGRARDFLYKFTLTDPVKAVFIGAWVDT